MTSSDDRWRTKTIPPADVRNERFYLLVVQRDSSSMFDLPHTGVVVLGRAPESDLVLDDETASRSHARIITADGTARLHDLDSHNGTFVNGERVAGTRVLVSGDAITIGEMTLVLHAQPCSPEAHPILDAAALRQRLLEEVERAIRYERSLALVSLALPATARRDEVAAALAAQLRLIDVVGWAGDGQLIVALPEVGADAYALATLAAALAPGARVGLATCPDDACDADTLLAAARAAVSAAQPDSVVVAAVAREVRLGDHTIVVADPAMVRLFDLIARLAKSDLPILILGETGAGKEGAALAVHHGSQRAGGPFVTLNCAAIPETLIESELFGHEKGAFTGAVSSRPGKLEAAHGGTLFLDEIGELPSAAQAKLLRAVEHKRVTRVGDVRERDVDLRVVAATNRALDAEVKAGRFRQDLYFRLGAATIVLPPLRDRRREIPILARRFIADACARAGREAPTIAAAAVHKLVAYRWPGNVRELRNVLEYVVATVQDNIIEAWHLPDQVAGVEAEPADEGAADAPGAGSKKIFRRLSEELRELERTRMLQALAAAAGVQRRGAELIGMPLRTFAMKVKQYGISPRARFKA